MCPFTSKIKANKASAEIVLYHFFQSFFIRRIPAESSSNVILSWQPQYILLHDLSLFFNNSACPSHVSDSQLPAASFQDGHRSPK